MSVVIVWKNEARLKTTLRNIFMYGMFCDYNEMVKTKSISILIYHTNYFIVLYLTFVFQK